MDRKQNIQELKLSLVNLGANDVPEELIAEKIEDSKSEFLIKTFVQFVNTELEKVLALFKIEQQNDEQYRITKYEFSRLNQINIDPDISKMYGVEDLEDRFRSIDWENANLASLGTSESISLDMINDIQEVLNELDYLKAIDKGGRELAERLEAKYLLNTPFDITLQNIEELNAKYQRQLKVELGVDDEFSIEQANNLFNGNPVFVPGIENSGESDREKDHWIEMDENGETQIIYPGNDFNLRDKIADLPIQDILGNIPVEDIAQTLEKGGAYKATYLDGISGEKVVLTAEPSSSSLRLDFVNPMIDEIKEIVDLEASRIGVYADNPNMPPDDIELLEQNIMDHGFSDQVIPGLHKNIRQGKEEFQMTTYGKKGGTEYRADLKFKADEQGKVGFKSYQLTVSKPDDWKEPFVQNIPVGEGLNPRLNEALNLMLEKSVLMDMPGENNQKNRIWMQMEFHRKQSDGNYPVMPMVEQRLNVSKALDDFNLPNLEYGNIRQELVKRLEKGDTLEVTAIIPSGPIKVDMTADPKINGFSFRAKDGSIRESRDLIDTKWVESRKPNARKRNDDNNDDDENKTKRRNNK